MRSNVGFDLSKVEGLPANLGFGKQIFGCKKGQSIVPHGHANMCTGFIVLKGKWHGKHYDRVETHADHYVIKPTIDRHFEPGDLSTISDHKDNVHWFKSESDAAYIFNVHVIGYDPKIKDDQRPALPRSRRREARGRAGQGAEDVERRLPQEVWVIAL